MADIQEHCRMLNSGLVAEWHFDGNSQDSSGNGNHGAVYGAKYVDGIKGQALAFDGMDNYFWAPISDALNSVRAQGTVLTWVNFSDTYLIKESGTSCSPGSRSLTILRYGTYSIKSQAYIDCAGRMQSGWRVDDSYIGQTTNPMLSHKWTLMTLVYDGKNVIQYINGEKVNFAPLSGQLNNSDGVARFYGEGVKGLKYAAQAEVVGGARKAKLILRAWAEKEDALTGFYHGILDEIEKRINVKGFIDEPIVQHFNIAGHLVTGQVGRIVDVGDRSVIPKEDGVGH